MCSVERQCWRLLVMEAERYWERILVGEALYQELHWWKKKKLEIGMLAHTTYIPT